LKQEELKVGVDARLLCLPPTGIGRYTAELCNNLCLRGVEVFCYLPGALSVAYSLDRRIKVRVRAVKKSGETAKIVWSQTSLPALAARDSVDLLWGASHRLPWFLPRKIARVVTIHDLVWRKYPQTMRKSTRWAERLFVPAAVHAADQIIADSRSTETDLLEAFPRSRDKISVVYPGAGIGNDKHSNSDDCLACLGIKRSFFLFVGTLEPRKNLKRLVSAYGLLSPEMRQKAQMVIVGGQGWGGLQLCQWIRSRGLVDDVLLTGYVTDEQLSALYAAARFLAMPSLYEGFGFPVLESMSRGTPALVSNVSSLPEICGDAAVMVDPLDETSIAKGLNGLISGPQRDDLARRAKPQASKFSWEKAAAEVEKVFRKAIEERNPSNS
jgi:glycosyltransferase involved in cell wall biosynthesis